MRHHAETTAALHECYISFASLTKKDFQFEFATSQIQAFRKKQENIACNNRFDPTRLNFLFPKPGEFTSELTT